MTYTEKILAEFDEQWDNYKLSVNSSDHYDGADRDKIKAFLSETIKRAEQAGYERGVRAVELPTHDHSKCPIKQTCIGYQSAESDLENVKDILLSSLDTNPK